MEENFQGGQKFSVSKLATLHAGESARLVEELGRTGRGVPRFNIGPDILFELSNFIRDAQPFHLHPWDFDALVA